MHEFDDPFDLAPQSRSSGQRSAEGQEIRFVGHPILACSPATNDLLAAAEFNEHPLIADRYFYSLPPALWQELLTGLHENEFDAGLLRMERILATVCGDHSSQVGIWHGQYVSFQGLRPMADMELSDDDFRAAGMKPIEARQALRLFAERDAAPMERFRRGYAGWLLTNQQFLDEHDVLLTEYAQIVRRWGTHLAGIVVPSGTLLPGTDPTEDPGWNAFNAACEEFFARWRLQSLAGPYLPVPLQALMAGSFPWTVVQHLMRAGGVFFLPDTMPIPSRDQLRGLLDHALHRGEQPDHLNEWLHIIRSSSGARNQLDRFARLFEIQHYWRLLRQRHASALEGNISRVETALARFFGISPASIHADLIEIRDRLGEAWLDRPWPN
jgi:hypothetical protein